MEKNALSNVHPRISNTITFGKSSDEVKWSATLERGPRVNVFNDDGKQWVNELVVVNGQLRSKLRSSTNLPKSMIEFGNRIVLQDTETLEPRIIDSEFR